MIDNIHGQRLGGRERLAGGRNLIELAARDDAHHVRQDHHREQAELGFRHAELGDIGTDRHITGTYQTEATRQGVAVDPCDDRHTAALQAPEQLNDVVARIGWVDDEGRAIGAGPRAVDSVPQR